MTLPLPTLCVCFPNSVVIYLEQEETFHFVEIVVGIPFLFSSIVKSVFNISMNSMSIFTPVQTKQFQDLSNGDGCLRSTFQTMIYVLKIWSVFVYLEHL